MRDPVADHLLTPQNSALVVIDYQPSQVQTVTSMDRDLLVDNIVSVARLAKTFDLPVVLSTVNVANGQQPTIPELKAVLADSPRSTGPTINSWEDVEFRRAVEATGRKKLIMAALWTEVCLAFPRSTRCATASRCYPVVDAVGGTSARSAPRRTRTDRAGGGATDQLGVARLRAATRLGSRRDRRRTSWTSCSRLACSPRPDARRPRALTCS